MLKFVIRVLAAEMLYFVMLFDGQRLCFTMFDLRFFEVVKRPAKKNASSRIELIEKLTKG